MPIDYILCNVYIPNEQEPEEVLLAVVPRVGEKLSLGNEDLSTSYEVLSVEHIGFRTAPKGKKTATVRLSVRQARQPRVGGRRT
jgi:hypothetical protein